MADPKVIRIWGGALLRVLQELEQEQAAPAADSVQVERGASYVWNPMRTTERA